MSWRLSLCCFGVWLSVFACGSTGAPAQDYGSLLNHLTEDVILPEHRDFVAQSKSLVAALQALSDKPSSDTLQAAQGAWRDARKAYRVLDALHFGPDDLSLVSSRIDVSPADPDGIEAIVAGTDAVDDQAARAAGGKKKGFFGLQYLLFADPAMPDALAPALVKDDSAERRRTFAISIGDEIQASAQELDDAWEPSGVTNYAQQLEQAGNGSTVYATQRAAVDDLVSGGVAYALEQIVGVRLALPLGLKSGKGPDPSQDPTRLSDNAVADMQATLSGVVAMYTGKGFSAVVRGKSSKLDDTVQAELADAKAKLSAIPAPFAEALSASDAPVQAAYDSTKALKATWNTDVSSALGATLKPADTDGD